jgi:hypothetical protein
MQSGSKGSGRMCRMVAHRLPSNLIFLSSMATTLPFHADKTKIDNAADLIERTDSQGSSIARFALKRRVVSCSGYA